MNPAEIAAYVGAGAWIPQIATWIYKGLVRPVITLVPETQAQVGFTSYGPIFNLQLALSAERGNAIVDGMEAVIRHSDGVVKTFRWSGLNETFSEIRDETGNRQQTIGRDQTPIALKVGTASLIEKFVRFQEPRYHETIRPLFSALVARFRHLQRTDASYVSTTLQTKELFDLLEARTQSFWWKAGKYTVEFRLSSPSKIRFPRGRLCFELSPADIELLRQNLHVIKTELENIIKSNLPDFQSEPINWNWANVEIRRPV
jgi:hypothetical protein